MGLFRFAQIIVVMAALLAGAVVGAGTGRAQSGDELDVLNRQVAQLLNTGKYTQALPLAQHTLALAERRFGPHHLKVAVPLNNLGQLYFKLGRSTEAEPLFKRDLAITEKALGPDHPDVGTGLSNLAQLYREQGRYTEAEPLYRRDLAITEKARGPDHPDVGTSLNNLAGLYRAQGRYAEAEPLYKRDLAITEKALGPGHPDVGISLNNLALLYRSQGRTAEAEPLYKRALAIAEKASGPDHPDVGLSLSNLAGLYHDHGRIAEAEPLYKRALAIAEKALGPDHSSVATRLNNLAELYRDQGRSAAAEPLYERSLAIKEKGLGPDHPDVGTSLSNLAGLYISEGDVAKAEPLYKRALAIAERALGPDHPDVGARLNNLAELYRNHGRAAEAEPLYKRALAIMEKMLGRDHPDVGTSLNNLAGLYFQQQDWVRAADHWRRSTGVIVRRAQRGTHDVGQSLTGKRKSEAEQLGWRFEALVKVAYRLAPSGNSALQREMFETAQWAQSSEAAQSLAQMAARGAKGDPKLAAVVRERQDLVAEWQQLDSARNVSVAQAPDKRDVRAEAVKVVRLAAIDARIADIDKRLVVDFPDYASLANPAPLSVGEVQAQLGSDEAMVLFLDTTERKPAPEESFFWVITKTDAQWGRIELGTKALTERVAALRCGLDHTSWYDASSWPEATEQHKRENATQVARRQRCIAFLRTQPFTETIGGTDKQQAVQVLPFDLVRAHELYKALLGPVEHMIRGKKLFIAPSGPLTSLPFTVLVTESPKTTVPTTLAHYRDVTWLGARQPITVLPSVSSLKSLRQFAKASRATKPYLGIGNPLLDGPDEHYAKLAQAARDKQQCPKALPQRIALAAARPRAGFAKLFRGANADIEELRQFAPLPETADELCTVGRRLGVPESEILLGSRATETTLKELSERGRFAEYRILHFATHGVLTGQVKGSAEPGLILTPPVKGMSDLKLLDRDDGFLTASEIATLKLDADWVILSACNTAGGSGETAEALSGMARAFFYAGARALLVSHWEVGSDAAVKLTTRAFTELQGNPKMGRAEAFRLSMRELMEKGSLAEAHPSQWAPFVVVGEGAK